MFHFLWKNIPCMELLYVNITLTLCTNTVIKQPADYVFIYYMIKEQKVLQNKKENMLGTFGRFR